MKRIFSVDTGIETVAGYCDCCGHKSKLFRGYVYEGDAAHGVYVGYYTARHPQLGVSMAISLGGWGEHAEPSHKKCVLLEWRNTDTGPACRVVDGTDTFWLNEHSLGRVLTRDEAVTSGLASEALTVSDAIWLNDERLPNALNSN